MRKILLLGSLVVFFLSSCTKEKIEQKVEDIVVQVMVDGVWLVTKYQEGSDDQTQLFAGWECQFFENRTCIAKHNNGTVVNGTWDGSYANQSMTGFFGTQPPLSKMNGTWKIVRSTYTVGQFTRMENGVEHKLEIQKK